MVENSQQLYLDDSHLLTFEAIVVRSGPKYAILDRTAFYPEGGGQPSDIGIFKSGNDSWKVLKVIKRGSEIFHYLEKDILQGTKLICVIDFSTRSWNMRRHSAEHLLTGLIEALGEPPKVYSDLERLEYQPSSLNNNQLNDVLAKFNNIVVGNLPVKVYYEDRTTINASDDPRKQSFLKKILPNVEKLRMVDIGGYALTFCMGTHVKSTKEIGRLSSLKLLEGKKDRKIVYFNIDPNLVT
jgi:Ser-tRNA(Ala) deacylase AlaX